MKINGNQVKISNILDHKGALWRVSKVEHVKPGKGGAFAQVEMKDIRVGTKLNERFRADEKIERISLEQNDYTFLFEDGDMLNFMHPTTFDQIMVNKELAGDAAVFLQDGMTCTLESFEEEVLSVALPETVVMEVVEAEPVVKGQTASASYKPAVLENGVRVMVPPFIEQGVRIKVYTLDATYAERAKD